jgi:hypothetical protein
LLAALNLNPISEIGASHAHGDCSALQRSTAPDRRAPIANGALGQRRGPRSAGIASAAHRAIHCFEDVGFASDLTRLGLRSLCGVFAWEQAI